MTDKELIEKIATGGILGVAGAILSALMSKAAQKETIRNSFAGLVASFIITVILRNSTWNPQLKEFLIGASSAFIAIYWPELNELIKLISAIIKWLLKKIIEKKMDIKIPDDLINNKKDVPDTDNN